VKLLEDADSIGYDPTSKFLYIDNGGGDVHQTYSMLSVVDTTAGKKVVDIKVDGDTLEAMVLEKSSPRIYLNNKAKSQVDVIDREKRTLLASWPITLAKTNVAMAYDEANHRLFIACRSGGIVVLDTQSGKELSVLPITKGVDDLVFDPASKRLYASCDGDVSVYQQNSPDSYKLLGKVPTGPLARTALLVPQLNRYFVAVPQHGTTNAEILVFEVH
jgi:DNA-binding beta-propeller fold protein YncE